MELSGMTLKELFDKLDGMMAPLERSWSDRAISPLRAELKRRCEGATEPQYVIAAPYNCPRRTGCVCSGAVSEVCDGCPLLAKGDLTATQYVTLPPPCPKCGRVPTAWTVSMERLATMPCMACWSARPSAPSGYEYTQEWDKPNGRVYLGFIGDEPVPCVIPTDEPQWILRKVEEKRQYVIAAPHDCPRSTSPRCDGPVKGNKACEACPISEKGNTAGEVKLEPFGVAIHLKDLDQRLKKLEKEQG